MYYSTMKTSFDKGREEGREERSLEIARSLKRMGIATSDIVVATGLTAEEIEAL